MWGSSGYGAGRMKVNWINYPADNDGLMAGNLAGRLAALLVFGGVMVSGWSIGWAAIAAILTWLIVAFAWGRVVRNRQLAAEAEAHRDYRANIEAERARQMAEFKAQQPKEDEE